MWVCVRYERFSELTKIKYIETVSLLKSTLTPDILFIYLLFQIC